MPKWLPDRALLWNVGLVYILQGSNLLLGLITAPYLSRALGVTGFGAFSYCVSANLFVWILIDWGYGIGAMREVAMARTDPEALRRTFWRAVNGRAVMLGPAAVLLLALSLVSKVNPPWVVLASGGLTAVGAVLACDWFVMGVERMGIFLVISVLSRAATFIPTVLLVRRPEHAHLAALIYGLGGLVTGVAGLATVLRFYPLGRPRFQLREGAIQIWEYRHYFFARSNALLYATLAPVVLGIAATPAVLGVFAGADKIVRACIMVVAPLGIALSARINATIGVSRDRAGVMSGRVVMTYLVLTIPMALALLLFGEHIAVFVLGGAFRSAADVIRVLSPTPVLLGLSGSLAGQFLVPLGRAEALSRVTLISSGIYFVSLAILGSLGGAIGAGIAFVLAELCLVVGFLVILMRHDRPYMSLAFGGLIRRT